MLILHELLFVNFPVLLPVFILLFLFAVCLLVFRPVQAKKYRIPNDSRAWAELDLEALRHNAAVLKGLLPKTCELMAVVKANAYGHGDIKVSKALNSWGVSAFAVATLAEGVRLRKNGIKGTILILGYTDPRAVPLLVRCRLTQTVVDCAYAEQLSTCGKKVHVHIKVDTGMHRLGIDYSDIQGLEKIFLYHNLSVDGMFSHLCVSDSLTEDSIAYTKLQTDRFFETAALLQAKGYDTGKLHLQASYGIINYPNLPCDYARAGIALYGVLSDQGETRTNVDLRPVLSIRARIAAVKQIAPGESVSYGRVYIASSPIKAATVTIGYADGLPRNLSEANSYVLLHSQKAPIIGRICMDQLIIDVTQIDNVKPNDVVTLIGTDGVQQIRCEDIAMKCKTITNEILSRLSVRLNNL